MIIRIAANLALLLAIIVLPYWFYLPMLFIAVIVFPFFWEGLVFAFLIDTLYGEGVGLVPSFLAVSSFASIVALIYFRERIRFYV